MASYTIPIEDFLNTPSIKVFKQEVAGGLKLTIDSVSIDDVNVIVDIAGTFDMMIDGGLRAVAAQHLGDIIPTVHHYSSVSIVQTETVISQQTEWQDLGGIVGDFFFFSPSMEGVGAKVTGLIKTSGMDLPKLRIMEYKEGVGRELTDSNFIIANTESEWAQFGYRTTEELEGGFNTYALEGRLEDCKSFSIKYCTFTLFKLTY